jgi:CarD family transcriptional regulator
MTEKETAKQPTGSKKEPRQFQIGDLAVYPAHGVGRIEAIESKVISGEKHDFYIMKVLENNMVIMIPTWNVESVGLRDVINEEDIPKIYDVMKRGGASPMDNHTWTRLKQALFLRLRRFFVICIC